ncbi:MAG: tRNA (adenosine(37)-N6)-threonylcarbamoyltransferase complex dimerization subunit type 1 TsaB [Aridibacter sp.]
METSVKGGSLSIFRNGKLIDFHIGGMVSGSEDLLPQIAKLLEKNDISKSDIESITVSNGPGSFTGIRIGIATALALKKSLNCKCYGVDLLKAMAFHRRIETKTENILTAVSQGRNKICWFDFKSESVNFDNPENKYVVGDAEILFNAIGEKINKKRVFTVYTDSDIYKTLGKHQLNYKYNLVNAGENLSLILGHAVLNNTFKFAKPKPVYLCESNPSR